MSIVSREAPHKIDQLLLWGDPVTSVGRHLQRNCHSLCLYDSELTWGYNELTMIKVLYLGIPYSIPLREYYFFRRFHGFVSVILRMDEILHHLRTL